MKPTKLALLAVTAVLGFSLIITGIRIISWREEQDRVGLPVDLPLPMSTNKFTDDFTVLKDGTYLIAISADRTMPSNNLDCLLGIDDALVDKCEGIQPAVNATWSIFTGGTQVASGLSGTERVAGWSERTFKGIGRFSGKRDQPYRLEMTLLSDLSPLRSTKPRVQVFWLPSNDPNEYGNSIRYALAKPGGIASLVVGFILIAFVALIGARQARVRA